MKKFTLIMLMAGLLVPMSLSARTNVSTSIKTLKTTKQVVNIAKRGDATMPVAVKPTGNTQFLAMPKAAGDVLFWDFEDATTGLSPFTVEDKDGDGFNWTYFNNDVADQNGDKHMTTYEGVGVIASASYDNDTQTALHPDNWLISPEVTLGGFLSFYACGQDANYSAEKFGVYVTVDGTNYTQIGADKTATSAYALYEYDLSAYAGQTGYFAIVHHNVSDMFFLNIDNITFNPAGEVTPQPGMPTALTATPAATYADIAWTPGENNGTWNLRWRPYVDPALICPSWTFPYATYQQEIEGWGVVDNDQDGNGWGLAYSSDAQDDLCFFSASWDQTAGDLTPDNWLLTPVIGMGGSITFKAWNGSATYADKIMVYYAPETATSLNDFVAISDFITPGDTPEDFTIDLSAYEGMGIIAFRHYDSAAMFQIMLDDISVNVPGGISPADVPDWTLVENVANPYTLEGLTPETDYEVQVMAFNEQGDKATDWTESTMFTTLAEDPAQGIEELYLVGSFNEWNWQNEEGRVPCTLNENNEFVVTCDFADGDEFKLITPDETNPTGWKWFGGVDEAGVGYFLVTEDLYNVGISLIDGANFKMELGGNYTITVSQSRGLVEPLIMTVKYNEPTAITDVEAAKAQDNTWYNIQGMKLQGVPTAAGIYINGGKKVVIK